MLRTGTVTWLMMLPYLVFYLCRTRTGAGYGCVGEAWSCNGGSGTIVRPKPKGSRSVFVPRQLGAKFILIPLKLVRHGLVHPVMFLVDIVCGTTLLLLY